MLLKDQKVLRLDKTKIFKRGNLLLNNKIESEVINLEASLEILKVLEDVNSYRKS